MQLRFLFLRIEGAENSYDVIPCDQFKMATQSTGTGETFPKILHLAFFLIYSVAPWKHVLVEVI